MHRAGIHNIWHYDDQVFDFADGRLLLRGRNGAGKSKALEMLLPFLLDGDARRLDTTGTGRTGFRWLMADGRTAAPAHPDAAADREGPGAEESPDEEVRIGYLWVEFAQDGEDAPTTTLGAAVTAAPGRDVRCTHFVTGRRVGTDLELVRDGRPMPVERLRAEVGAENCYDTAGPYRARVMRDLFGLDDPVRYRNLVHLLYRLRRPTIGERLEAGELVSVLAEALPPMDESVLDQVARNVADLEEARGRLEALRGARGHVEEFLTDYRGYLHRVLGERAAEVRTGLDEHARRAAEAERLEEELDRLVTEESTVQEERDRARRTRDTAGSDAATLTAAGEAAPTATDHELQARYAAVTAYIRAAEAAWTAAGYALTAEERAKETLAGGLAAVDDAVAALRTLHAEAAEAARAGGIDPELLGTVPQPVRTVLAPRESVTHVDFEGLERAVERDPVPGVDLDALRGGLADLHDRLTRADEAAAERAELAERLRAAAAECAGAEEREAALRGEAESADAALERARARERAAVEAVRAAGASYAARVRTWLSDLREAAPDADLDAAAAALEELVEPPHDDALGLLGPDVPARVAEAAHAAVDPLLRELRSRRDTALGEERELVTELDELSERKAGGADPAPPAPPWADAVRDRGAGAPLYALVDFADGLGAAERAGLEGALEASGLLNAWIAADGSALSADTSDVVLSPGRPAPGPSLLDVLTPLPEGAEEDRSGIGRDRVEALLSGIALLPADGDPGAEPRHRRRRDGEQAGPACAVALDGRWRLGTLSGAHRKAAAEHIGTAARGRARDRSLANVERRIDIAEALLAEAGERRGDAERAQDLLVEISRGLPGPDGLAAAWAALEGAREWLAGAAAEQRTAARAAEEARGEALALRRSVQAEAERAALPAGAAELAGTAAALDGLRVRLAAALRDLQALAVLLDRSHGDTEQWRQARGDRVVAEDARTAAIGDMITVRRDIELTDRARAADPDRIGAAVAEVRERMEAAADRVPDLERSAQRARDERVAAETRLGSAAAERAEQARRVLEAGAALRAALTGAGGEPDPDLLAAAGLEGAAEPLDRLLAADAAEEDERLAALEELTAAVQAGLDAAEEGAGEEVDDSGILRRREALHRLLSGGSSVGARTELTEHSGVKRVTVHDDAGAHDVTAYAARLAEAEAEAEEAALLREEEAYERHLLGELAGHLARQIDEARALIATMNEVLGDVTTSQGLGVRIEWGLAPDADEDVRAVVPLLARPAERRTRLETTRLRDALRRCIEAIRRLDPTATGGAQLRAALDYRSWFAFTVHITDAARPDRERRLSHRTGLSQGEQRVVAYLVLFAAAAAQFDAVQANAPAAPRLILLDDAFAKVDEPTHGRLLGLLVQLDLDFVLTSERVWGCFASVPGLHIYECLRDPAVPGIATLHFSWDGARRRLLGV
nr:TIGR02680 family protein [Nocardiopsis composta]